MRGLPGRLCQTHTETAGDCGISEGIMESQPMPWTAACQQDRGREPCTSEPWAGRPTPPPSAPSGSIAGSLSRQAVLPLLRPPAWAARSEGNLLPWLLPPSRCCHHPPRAYLPPFRPAWALAVPRWPRDGAQDLQELGGLIGDVMHEDLAVALHVALRLLKGQPANVLQGLLVVL